MEPDELVLAIARQLEIDYQYVKRVEAWNAEGIAEVRAAGRRAGRLLGWRIFTHQALPDDENRVTVIVAVRDYPNEEERQRMSERARLLIDSMWPSPIPPDGSDG
jgi:hypothetical protein